MSYCHHCGRYIASGLLCEYCTESEISGREKKTLPHGDKADAEAGRETNIEKRTVTGTGTDAETETESTNAEKKRCWADELGTEADTAEWEHGNKDGDMPAKEGARKRGNGAAGVARRYRPRLKRVCEGGRRQCREVFSHLREIPRTPDTTAAYSTHDIRRHRGMAVLCYLWILWAVPFLRCRSSRFVRYHLGQGALLLLLDCLGMTFVGMACLLSPVLPMIVPVAAALAEVVCLLSCTLKVFGIVTAARGCARELPILGGYGKIDG